MSQADEAQRVSVALVTGAASGIGFATAVRLSEAGHAVVGVDRDPEGLRDLERRVSANGVGFAEVVGDVREERTVDAGVAAATELGGGVHVLVNNAGLGVFGTIMDTSLEDWRDVFDVNVTATFLFCRAVLDGMLARGGGIIVNVGSVGAVVGVRQRFAYCSAKAAIVGLTRALAADHAGDGIRANVVCPGTVSSPWVERMVQASDDPEGQLEKMKARQLDGRMGTPDEVASSIAFLASDEARFFNGSVLIMDGGMTAV